MPKAARKQATAPNIHPLASLVLGGRLKEYTFSTVRDYLRLYAAECHGLNHKAMRAKTKFVLRQLDKARIDQALDTPADGLAGTTPASPTPEPSNQPEQRLTTSDHDHQQDNYHHLDNKPFLVQVPLRLENFPVVERHPRSWLDRVWPY